jgi:hypothetical protein
VRNSNLWPTRGSKLFGMSHCERDCGSVSALQTFSGGGDRSPAKGSILLRAARTATNCFVRSSAAAGNISDSIAARTWKHEVTS